MSFLHVRTTRVAPSYFIPRYFFYLGLCLSAFTFYSCKSDPKPNASTPFEETPKIDSIEVETPLQSEENSSAYSTEYLELHFSDISIYIEHIDANWTGKDYHGNENEYLVSGDTAELDPYIGEDLMGQEFYVSPEEYDEVKMWVKSIRHPAVSSKVILEVPFCVLSRMEHWESEWQTVPMEEGNKFHFVKIVEEEVEQDFDPMKIRELVGDDCGEHWYDEFQEYTTLEEMGFELFVSQFIYKLEFHNGTTGEYVTKYIVVNRPTHC